MDGSSGVQASVEHQMQQCIDLCLKAHDLCLATAMYRIELGNEAASIVQVRLLLDCAELCQTHANSMSRRSEYHSRISPICADLCDRVATACEMMAEDPQFRRCAEICRQAGASCNAMTQSASALGAAL